MSVNLLNKVSIDAGGGNDPLELTIGAAADNVSFNNMGTGLSATNVQTALKQVLAQNGYAVCDTAGNVAAKTVTITDFVLRVGSRLIIKFENQNLASSPTLNVNNTGAKALKVNGEDINPAIIEEDSVFLINYNGNSYDVIIGGGVNAGANITMEEYTFLASGWSNSEYSLESDYPSSRYDIIEIGSSNTHTTQAMLDAWQAAEIYGWESINKIVARGTVPSIDIIMVLVIVDKSTSGGGHVIKDSTTEFTKRTGLKFVGATVTDDSAGDNTVVTYDKNSIGLGNVDNTSDLNKPISTATQIALDDKANISALPTKVSDLTNDSNFIDNTVNNLTNYYTKTETDAKVSSVYRYRGSVNTYADLPSTGLVVGDVYNVATADTTHNIPAGSNVAWTGTEWDKLAGDVDLTGYYTKTETNGLLDDKVDKVTGKGLSTEDYTTVEKTKLSGIETGAQVNTITGVKGDSETDYRTGNVNITKVNIGLGNVDNTSDLNKPISTATQTALDNKMIKVTGTEGQIISFNAQGNPVAQDLDVATIKACYDETIALYAHAVGDIIYVNDHFYVVTSAITKGTTIADGTNVDDAELNTDKPVYVSNIPGNEGGGSGGGGITSHIGQIIFSSTLDTEEKVIEIYGGNSWTKIEGRFLLGASSSYANGSEGGAESHSHSLPTKRSSGYNDLNQYELSSSSTYGANHMPPYRAVYIWERTA